MDDLRCSREEWATHWRRARVLRGALKILRAKTSEWADRWRLDTEMGPGADDPLAYWLAWEVVKDRTRPVGRLNLMELWETGYGACPAGLKPEHFHPDVECCTEEELKAWEAASAPMPKDGAHHWTRVEVQGPLQPGETREVVTTHHSVARWGIGTYQIPHRPLRRLVAVEQSLGAV